MSTPSERLHTFEVLPYTTLNHVFILLYVSAIFTLFYHHIHTLLHTTTFLSFFLHLSLLLSDAIFAFLWATLQGYHIRPIKRKTYPENLPSHIDYPALDVFICTADPYKEPPMNVVNTALSVLAYDYPADKVSVYVSDDGGSVLTLFAFMEAAKFAGHWLPFCRDNNVLERCPEAYFRSSHALAWCSEAEKMKTMYESMQAKVESVVDKGGVGDEDITSKEDSLVFKKWVKGFTRQEHPAVIQVLLDSSRDKDITGHGTPNLIYVSREKSKTSPHHFKAGALNALLRVSAVMTNAPLILTQDCDMFSNDPKTPLNALCFLMDKAVKDLAYIQFPQRFHGINKNDIYGSEMKRLFFINIAGMDGLSGPNYVGTGCFFRRRAFFGGPLSQIPAEILELNPDHVVGTSILSEKIQELAHIVASCTYENGTSWGSKMGFRYGSLVEDYYTGYRLQCEGWKSVFCNPDRAAFLGDVPFNLNDMLSQVRRWAVGLSEVAYSKYDPIVFGTKFMGLPMGLCYAHYAFWPMWSIPIAVYAFLPSLALLSRVYLFPKVSSPWFYLYMFLFLGAYGQDFLDFVVVGGTFKQWYNDQRMWMIKGLTSYSFGLFEYVCKSLGVSAFGFNVTSKVVEDKQRKRYEQGIFEFGVASPLFVPLTTTAIVNLIAIVIGFANIFKQGDLDEMFLQLSLCGFVVMSSWPIYEAIVLRVDMGKMPPSITLISIFLAWVLYLISLFIFRS